MSDKIKSDFLSPREKHLTAIFFLYAINALIFGFAYRYALNPDGLSLLRLSGYIVEGNFIQSIASGWSPLITWLIAPFIFFGFDGLTAARIAIAFCGAGLLLCSWLLASRFNLSENNKFIALLIVALLTSFWTIQFIAADVLIAALTLLYIYLVTDPAILNNRRAPFICGIVGGISYLAHHYAFPFFLAHFLSILLMKGYIDRDREGFPVKKILISWGLGIAGFAIIASIWIGTVSVRYGKFTISSKGPIAHAAMGPKDVDRRPPHFYGGLNKPKNKYSIHVFEDPSGLEFKTWSPFESKEYFIHQLKLIKDNAVDILNHFVKQSPFFTYAFVLGVLALIPIAFLLNPLNRKKKTLYAWVMITFSIYCSGFLLLIARSPRRFYPLMIIFVLLSFHFLEELKNAFRDIASDRGKQLVGFYLLIIVVSAFALKPGVQLVKSLKNVITIEQVNPYGEIAEQINKTKFPSPYAMIRSSQKPHTDLYIAYFLKKQFLGRPLSTDAEGIAKEMRAADAKSLLVFDNPEIVEKLKSDNRFQLVASMKFKNTKRYEQTVNINIRDHEIITGWDEKINIFTLK
jgi:MFS family permease